MAPIDFTQFHQVFQPDLESPYAQDLIREIESYRKGFDGVLFIDRVLKALGVTKAKAYPPRGENGLHDLHQKVCQSKMSAHHKLSVLYYLLLDHDDIMGVRSQLAEVFAQKSGIPNKYQILMKGLWHMDRQQFPVALEYLAHPSLLPEFADDIVSILVKHASPPGDYTWALAYYHSVQPVLKTPEALELLYGALARTSVAEAYWFSRDRQPEHSRRLLFERLVASVAQEAGAESRAAKIKTLVSLPLGADEERWLDEFLTGPEGRRMKHSRDIWLLRRVATDRVSEIGDEKLLAHLDTLGGRPQRLF